MIAESNLINRLYNIVIVFNIFLFIHWVDHKIQFD